MGGPAPGTVLVPGNHLNRGTPVSQQPWKNALGLPVSLLLRLEAFHRIGGDLRKKKELYIDAQLFHIYMLMCQMQHNGQELQTLAQARVS